MGQSLLRPARWLAVDMGQSLFRPARWLAVDMGQSLFRPARWLAVDMGWSLLRPARWLAVDMGWSLLRPARWLAVDGLEPGQLAYWPSRRSRASSSPQRTISYGSDASAGEPSIAATIASTTA